MAKEEKPKRPADAKMEELPKRPEDALKSNPGGDEWRKVDPAKGTEWKKLEKGTGWRKVPKPKEKKK